MKYFSENGMQFRRPDGDGLPTSQAETYHTIKRQHLGSDHISLFPLIVPKSTNVYQLVNYWNRQPDWKYVVES